MDPASATIAFVGFTASLITLSGLVTDSLQTLYNLQDKLKHAPKNLRRLGDDLRGLDLLFSEIKKTVVNDSDVSVSLKDVWKIRFTQMEQDLLEFKTLVHKLHSKLDGRTVSGLYVRLRTRWILVEEIISQSNERLSSHLQFLETIQSSIISTRTLQTSQNTTGNSQVLRNIEAQALINHQATQNALLNVQASSNNQSQALQIISAETSDLRRTSGIALDQLTKKVEQSNFLSRAISTELTDLRLEQSRTSLKSKSAILQGICAIETVYKQHDYANKLKLEDMQQKIDHLVRLGDVKASIVGPSNGSDLSFTNPCLSINQSIYLQFSTWDLPIGNLQCQVTTLLESYGPNSKTLDYGGQKREISTFKITFCAPSWLSTAILQLSYKVQSQSGLTNWNRNFSLTMQNYNPEPLLVQYLNDSNQDGLKGLFSQGKASPTDYLISGKPLLFYAVDQAMTMIRELPYDETDRVEASLQTVESLLHHGADVHSIAVDNHQKGWLCQDLVIQRFKDPEIVATTNNRLEWRLLALLISSGDEIREDTFGAVLSWARLGFRRQELQTMGLGDQRNNPGRFEEKMTRLLPFLDHWAFCGTPMNNTMILHALRFENPGYRRNCPYSRPLDSSNWAFGPPKYTLEQSYKDERVVPWDKFPLPFRLISFGTRRMLDFFFTECVDVNDFQETAQYYKVHSYIAYAAWRSYRLSYQFLLVDQLLNLGARPRRSREPSNEIMHDEDLCSSLCGIYSEEGSREDYIETWLPTFDRLLSLGFHVSSDPRHGRDLHLGPEVYTAVARNNPQFLQCLIRHNPCLTYDELQFTPLILAVTYGSVKMVRLLLEAGTEVLQDRCHSSEAVTISMNSMAEKHPRIIPFVAAASCYSTGSLCADRDPASQRSFVIKAYFQGDPWVSQQADQEIHDMLIAAFGRAPPHREERRPSELHNGPRHVLIKVVPPLDKPEEITTQADSAITTDTERTTLPHTENLENLRLSFSRLLLECRFSISHQRHRLQSLARKLSPSKVLASVSLYFLFIGFLLLHESYQWASSLRRPPSAVIILLLIAILIYNV